MGARGGSIGTILGAGVGLLFLVGAVVAVYFVNAAMRHQALEEAESKALLLLDRNLATHAYFSHQLKPRLFELTGPMTGDSYFDPAWMSSTYAVRGAMDYFDELDDGGYYYKECAINARWPGNEADDYERSFIEKLNADPALTKLSGIREFDGIAYFTMLRRGEVMEQACLRCHSSPEHAPAELVERYGPKRSFGRQEGEVVSAVSIRVPIAKSYADANRITLRLSGLLLVVLLSVFLGTQVILRGALVRPVKYISENVLRIANTPQHLGEQLRKPKGRELTALTDAVNTMSSNLRSGRDLLEERVRDRTTGLEEANSSLRSEIEERKRAEEDLRSALAHVKTLRGLLPICASCKKVRDDGGYWKQIEGYISEHSEAEFSHSLCPDCAEKLYPDLPDERSERED